MSEVHRVSRRQLLQSAAALTIAAGLSRSPGALAATPAASADVATAVALLAVLAVNPANALTGDTSEDSVRSAMMKVPPEEVLERLRDELENLEDDDVATAELRLARGLIPGYVGPRSISADQCFAETERIMAAARANPATETPATTGRLSVGPKPTEEDRDRLTRKIEAADALKARRVHRAVEYAESLLAQERTEAERRHGMAVRV